MARRRRKGSIGERFRAGDEAALAEVFDEYAGPMLAVASSMLADRRLAEEAVQQAFVQAWRAASSFEPERPLGPWLRAIVRRTAVDVWRRERRHQARSFDDVPPADLPSVEPPRSPTPLTSGPSAGPSTRCRRPAARSSAWRTSST